MSDVQKLTKEYTSPEEEVNQELWWLFQEIKTEQLRTVAGEKIDFFFRDNKTLSKDIQEQLFYKLNSEGRLELERIVEPVGIPIVSSRRVFHDTLNRFTGEESYTSPSPPMKLVGFCLTIHQEKFNELYRSLETHFSEKHKEDQKKLSHAEEVEMVAETKKEGIVAKTYKKIKPYWKYITTGIMPSILLIIDYITDIVGVVKFIISLFKFSG